MSNPIVFRVREFNILCSRSANGEPVATELRSLDGELVPAHRAMKLWRAKSMGSALARALHEAREGKASDTNENEQRDAGCEPTRAEAAHDAVVATSGDVTAQSPSTNAHIDASTQVLP